MNLPHKTILSALAEFAATFFYIGYTPKLPGSAAAAASMPLAWLICSQPAATEFLALAAFILAAVVSASVHERITGTKDPGCIVIDEAAGFLTSVCFMEPSVFTYILAYAIFRYLDIAKPFGIKRIERLGGGTGIVLDDLAAGMLTNIAVRAVAALIKTL